MTKRELLRNGAQLAGLWGLAVAQPLFEVTKSGEAFELAGWRGGDIVVFALVVAFLPPAVMLALEALALRLRPSLVPPLHMVLVGCVAAILALYALKHETHLRTVPAMVLGLAAGAGAAYLFRRFEPFRSFVTVVSPASVLFVLLFLFASPVKHLVLPEAGADMSGPRPRAPVVFVLFDEFPTLSLLDRDGELDRRSYPGFAKLADDAIWFRNATTVADHTVAAVPAILTGRRQHGQLPASVSAQPNNILALFGRRGGAFAQESETHLCPRDICPDSRPRPLPKRVTRMFKPFVKLSLATWLPNPVYSRIIGHVPPTKPATGKVVSGFESFWATFGGRPLALRYLHRSMPHQPWTVLPSGKYWTGQSDLFDYVPALPRVPARTGLPSHGAERWTRNPRLVTNMHQRHLAQARYADRLLGETLERLHRSGLYDRALVVVSADHGVAFQPGLDARRLTHGNQDGIVSVPLFVKLPHQHRGRVSTRFVETIDIAPTIAAAVGVRLPWKTDGRSALDPSAPDRRRLSVNAIPTHERFTFDAATLARRLLVAARRQAALFYGNGPDRIFRPQPNGALVGRAVARIPKAPSPAGLAYAPAVAPGALDLQPGSKVIPALISGQVTGARAAGRQLAVVLNGRVAATTTAYRSESGSVRFEAFVAERYFKSGPNGLALYAIDPDGKRLAALPRARP